MCYSTADTFCGHCGVKTGVPSTPCILAKMHLHSLFCMSLKSDSPATDRHNNVSDKAVSQGQLGAALFPAVDLWSKRETTSEAFFPSNAF